MKRCVIFCAAPLPNPEKLPVDLGAEDFVIAVDGGVDHAAAAGVQPNLIMGDMDSIVGSFPDGVPVERFRSEKDDSDTMLAVRKAIELGYEEVILLFATGGRLDHSYSNIQALLYLDERGRKAAILDEDCRIYPIHNGKLRIKKEVGYNFSVFSASERSTGVYIRGAKYPLVNATVLNSFPIGLSNEFIKEEAEVSVKDGTLIVMVNRKELR